jgi:hypothetical protein
MAIRIISQNDGKHRDMCGKNIEILINKARLITQWIQGLLLRVKDKSINHMSFQEQQ